MKKLILVRHAKSDWSNGLMDKDRPLKSRGITRAMYHAGLLLDHLDYVPEYWASSYATRALHTATIFANKFDHINNLKIHKELYTFSSEDLESYITTIPNVIDSAILFGHNEALIDVINSLTSAGLEEFKTASCAIITFNQNRWEEVGNGKLISIISQNKIQ
ncbi:MAG: SixA phosphatase family protein [Weeksellaceae bacterium]